MTAIFKKECGEPLGPTWEHLNESIGNLRAPSDFEMASAIMGIRQAIETAGGTAEWCKLMRGLMSK